MDVMRRKRFCIFLLKISEYIYYPKNGIIKSVSSNNKDNGSFMSFIICFPIEVKKNTNQAKVGIEPALTALQAAALPLCHLAKS